MERDVQSKFYDSKVTYDFNSHAHVERDFFAMIENRIRFISTHTLTWSVTGKTYAVCEQEINFNSHAHVERDNIFINF